MPESIDPNEVIQEVEEKKQTDIDAAQDALSFFMDNIGNLYYIDEVVDMLEDDEGIESNVARRAVLHLVTDKADPVQMVSTDDNSLVGIIEFMKGDFWYGYEQYDDARGRNKRIICSQCVSENRHDSDVGATRGHDFDQEDVGYDEMAQWFYEHHFVQAHAINSGDVELDIGGSLASGTTIGGNTSWHNGNVTGGTGITIGTTSVSSHAKYTDSEAVGAVEAANPLSLQNNLRIAIGNAIEDDGGSSRITFASDRMEFSDEQIFVVQPNNDNWGDGLNLQGDATTEGRIKAIDPGNTSLPLIFEGARYDFTWGGAIRMADDESIQDGGATNRLEIGGSETTMNDDSGTRAFRANDGIRNSIFAQPGTPGGIYDDEGGFDAIQYTTSASIPGSLTVDANIDASSSDKMTLPQRTSDPSASAGDMWYRTDLD